MAWEVFWKLIKLGSTHESVLLLWTPHFSRVKHPRTFKHGCVVLHVTDDNKESSKRD
jgi:hypothetical protein